MSNKRTKQESNLPKKQQAIQFGCVSQIGFLKSERCQGYYTNKYNRFSCRIRKLHLIPRYRIQSGGLERRMRREMKMISFFIALETSAIRNGVSILPLVFEISWQLFLLRQNLLLLLLCRNCGYLTCRWCSHEIFIIFFYFLFEFFPTQNPSFTFNRSNYDKVLAKYVSVYIFQTKLAAFMNSVSTRTDQ